MSEITNPSLKNTVRQHFASLWEVAPTGTAIHGMLCALAAGPEGDADTRGNYAHGLVMPAPVAVPSPR